ncbi:hypothetical protein WJX75_002916 [Coccomyxa subellipsoidea]|uniref:Uncharacterized protein n=1 Tax=Coccomyxa subellipsoidea TaxID=248742 RepID=A0ABR2YRA2_9CHLO
MPITVSSTSEGGDVASRIKDASIEGIADDGDQENELSAEEIDRRIRKAAALIATAESLAPFDRRTFNASLLIWRAIADISAKKRPRLLGLIMPQDIVKLWTVAGQRYLAGRHELAGVQGPEYSLYDDFPEELNEVATYEGRAAVPLTSIFGGFRKLFFLQPRTFDLYGRVQVRKGPLGDLLYPLYYKCSIGTSTIPGTNELSDLQLEYLNEEQLGLQPADVPSSGRWPHIRPPRWPFNGGLVDYLRAVGPGVYVGVGWKQPGTAKAKRFLHFLLVRKYD